MEDESLIIQPTHPDSEKITQSCHVSSDRHDHTTECLSDTVMSRLFAQDESSQQEMIHSTTKSISNDGMKLILFHLYNRLLASITFQCGCYGTKHYSIRKEFSIIAIDQ